MTSSKTSTTPSTWVTTNSCLMVSQTKRSQNDNDDGNPQQQLQRQRQRQLRQQRQQQQQQQQTTELHPPPTNAHYTLFFCFSSEFSASLICEYGVVDGTMYLTPNYVCFCSEDNTI